TAPRTRRGAERAPPCSAPPRLRDEVGHSCGHGVDHDVYAEPGIVLGQEALVAEVVVPFAAVVLVAVEDRDAAVDLDCLEVVVDQVVAPAVQLQARGWRPVLEREERAVERMVVGNLPQCRRAEDRGYLRLERAG